MICKAENCTKEATYIAPEDWCDEHWERWWYCLKCGVSPVATHHMTVKCELHDYLLEDETAPQLQERVISEILEGNSSTVE